MQQKINQLRGKKIRAFFAITPQKKIIRSIDNIIRQLKNNNEKLFQTAKFTRPENLHITLSFLGDITPTQSQLLGEKAATVLKDFPQFPISLSKLLWFPKERPRMIILKTDPVAELLKLKLTLDKIIASCNIDIETRAYVPHTTLCRLKTPQKSKLPKLPNLDKPLTFTATGIELFRSDSDPLLHTSKYTSIKNFDLACR